ncbi:type 1 fimbrial protein [Rahnella sp. L72c]|uniref:Type 1 fimbrial protein n=1 Tax=Rahnella perminowiae TaxID=2816244 RepID=A0ABS6KVD5_9GAMM|nr:fimbrial protein [Rahnella perminowiae]MBU9833566.1 type 1 fimbrial protein [Rahnella perminowiae]
MYRILIILILISSGLFSRTVLAWSCTTPTPLTTLSVLNFRVPASYPVGSVIARAKAGNIDAFRCKKTFTGELLPPQTFGAKALGTFDTMINGRRIYKTNVNGIGYAITGGTDAYQGCSNNEYDITGSNTIKNDPNTVILCGENFAANKRSGGITVTFYKTASVVSPGTITARDVGSFIMLVNDHLLGPEAVVRINPITVIVPACTLSSTSISVDMGNVSKHSFKGKGSTPGEEYTREFNLSMICNAHTLVKYMMDGDIYNAADGIINTITGTGTASGVGIQILHNGTNNTIWNIPLRLREVITGGSPSADGDFSIPLKTRYYQTDSKISAGRANGLVTFTMFYE